MGAERTTEVVFMQEGQRVRKFRATARKCQVGSSMGKVAEATGYLLHSNHVYARLAYAPNVPKHNALPQSARGSFTPLEP